MQKNRGERYILYFYGTILMSYLTWRRKKEKQRQKTTHDIRTTDTGMPHISYINKDFSYLRNHKEPALEIISKSHRYNSRHKNHVLFVQLVFSRALVFSSLLSPWCRTDCRPARRKYRCFNPKRSLFQAQEQEKINLVTILATVYNLTMHKNKKKPTMRVFSFRETDLLYELRLLHPRRGHP